MKENGYQAIIVQEASKSLIEEFMTNSFLINQLLTANTPMPSPHGHLSRVEMRRGRRGRSKKKKQSWVNTYVVVK
eukprot:gene1916-5005_t